LSFDSPLQCYDLNVKGYTATLTIYNKGKDKEKSVTIIIPKAAKCAILSCDYPSITCENDTLTIDRLLPKQTVNICIYIESHEQLSGKNRPHIKSEDANGKAYASRSDVPASMGPTVLSASICLSLLALMGYMFWTDTDPLRTFYTVKYRDLVDQGLTPSSTGDNYIISKGSSGTRLLEILPVSASKNKLEFSFKVKNPTTKSIYVSAMFSAPMEYYEELSKISKTENKETAEKKIADIDTRYWEESTYDSDNSIRDAVIPPGKTNIVTIKKSKISGADPSKLEISVVIEGETEKGELFKDYYRITPAQSKNPNAFLESLK
jgi:hypothetical protein